MNEIWTVTYWRFQVRYTATFSTEKKAREFITDGERDAVMAADGITRPDGTFYAFRGDPA